MKRLATSIIFLLMLGFTTRSLGPLTEELTNLSALVLFLLFILIYYPLGAEARILKRLTLAIGFVVLAVLVSHIPDDIGRLAGISVVVVLLELVHRLLGREKRELLVFALTSLLCGFALFLNNYVPDLWWLSHKLSTTISGFVSGLGQRGFVLGPTASGAFILCSFGILYLSTFLFSQRRKATTLIVLFSSVFVAEALFLLVYPSMASIIRHFQPRWLPETLYLQPVLFLLLLIPTFFNFKNIEFRKIPVNIPRANWPQFTISALAFFLLCSLLSTSLLIGDKGKITFYEKGLLDWRVPVFGVYGERSSGMFGLLPKYLEANGYNTTRVSIITEDNLAESDVLVLINLREAVSATEKEAIWKFVKKGGSLLVLGDHTNVGGLMDSFNDLLEPVPIKFRFDSAKSGKYGWRDSLGFLPHAITYGLEDETDTQLWVGSSLDCQPPSSPVITGRYAHSDIGNQLNAQRAFMGNMILDPGEQLGDVILAAESRYGKGKVLVFGDTSSFQNSSLFAANEFVDGVFRWLVSKEIPAKGIWLYTASGICFVLAIVFLTRSRWSLTTLLICGVVLSVSIAVPRIIQGGEDEEVMKAEVAYIDYSHIGRFDLMSWEDDSVGGLSNNLLRNGFMPFLLRDSSEEKLTHAKLLVLIAPTKPFQKKEISEIEAFVDRGGTLVISVGWEESEAIAPLLESMGFYIDSVPLGPVALKRGEDDVSFPEAWPIICGNAETRVFAEQWGAPIAVVKKHGQGKIIAIGDSYFLLNQNLEGNEEYSLGNIILFRDMLQEGDGK